MQTYLFFRKEGFYPIGLPDDGEAIVNALINPGTLRVERALGGIVWKEGDKVSPANAERVALATKKVVQ